MNEDGREDIRAKISTFMDGEASDFEARRTLKEIAADAELKRKWYRYHLASSAMHNELPNKMGAFILPKRARCFARRRSRRKNLA